jgi:exoribonuclease-2
MQLRSIARKFRESRLAAGAVHISVPEINLWIGDTGEVNLNRVNRESPGRMLVAEIMIMANWLMARFLAEHRMPAVFRSQPEPRERLYRGEDGTLFQHWMQRRLLNRFVLGHTPEKHSGLGLNAYVTATSPIRKYFDLVTQRQVRAVLGLEDPYSAEDIDRIIQMLELPMNHVIRLQAGRQHYWLLKFLEQRIGQKEEAIVLVRRRNNYQVLLTNYMLEGDLPITGFLDLKPEDLVQVTIQKVSARRDQIALTIG